MLAVFVFERGLKIYVQGFGVLYECENNPDISWNLFDFFIVGLGVFDLAISVVVQQTGSGMARVSRVIRLMRVLRLVKILGF